MAKPAATQHEESLSGANPCRCVRSFIRGSLYTRNHGFRIARTSRGVEDWEELMQATIAERPKSLALAVVDPDLPLVHATRNGDVSAFEELVKRYDRRLYRIAEGITHSDEDAEEVVQMAFLKAYQNLNRFQGSAKFSTWLIRIAINESFMKLRKRQAAEKFIDYAVEREGEAFLVDVADWRPSPETLFSASEFREILINSLQKLTPALRA